MTDYTTRNLIPASSFTELYLRSAAQLVDIQAAAAQSYFRQWSQLLSASAVQAASFVQQTRQIQQHLVEQSTDVARAAAERTGEAMDKAASGFEGSRAAHHA